MEGSGGGLIDRGHIKKSLEQYRDLKGGWDGGAKKKRK